MITETTYLLLGAIYFFSNGIFFYSMFGEGIKEREYVWWKLVLLAVVSFAAITPIGLALIILGAIWHKLIKPVYDFFELDFFFTVYVFRTSFWRRINLYINETINDDSTVFDDEDIITARRRVVFLTLRNELLFLSATNPIKRFKTKLQEKCIKKIQSLTGFVPREDKDYRVFLRGGPLNDTPKGDWSGALYVPQHATFIIKNGRVVG